MPVPQFSVIIPAYNEEFELPRTLEKFREAVASYRLSGGTGEFEFIVADNRSTDRTAAIAAEWGARVIEEPVRRISRVRNAGIRAALGEFIVTCDADSQPHPRIFTMIERVMARNTFAGGVFMWPDRWTPIRAFAYGTVNLCSLIFRLPAAMFFIRRADLLAMGGFNESLHALEDVDLSKRIRSEAFKRGRSPAILASCPIRTSTRKFRLVRKRDLWLPFLAALVRPRWSMRQRWLWEASYYSDRLRDGHPERSL